MMGFKRFYEDRKTESFIPHKFESKFEMLSGSKTPKVLIDKVAFNKMWHYVDLASKEVSWLGTVERRDWNFIIKDVFLLKQEVSSSQTVITEDGLAEFGENILKKKDGVDIYNNIRFWGHSHVYMGTGASGQDESQMGIFEESSHPYFIRGILNKLGRIEFTIYLYDSGIRINDPEWCVYDPIDSSVRSIIEKEFEEKVKDESILSQYTNYGYGYGGSNQFNQHPQTIYQKRKHKNGIVTSVRHIPTGKG